MGAGPIAALSLLSAGELDILVTVANILSQQLYLQRKFGSEIEHEASGLVFIDELDAHLHPQWQEKVIPLYARLFPAVRFIFTTHSPFVLRSLPAGTTLVVRLPDGRIFDQDFSTWSADEILRAVFDVAAPWSSDIQAKIDELSIVCGDPDRRDQAVALYRQLESGASDGLRGLIDRIVAANGDTALRDELLGNVGLVQRAPG